MKALIAEDDKISLRVLKTIIDPFFDVTATEDGEAAFDAFADALEAGEKFDLVLLDIMMPLATGQEVLAAIRDLEQEHEVEAEDISKVIMVSALDDGINLYEAHASGCSDYITKPINREAVLKTLRRNGMTHVELKKTES